MVLLKIRVIWHGIPCRLASSSQRFERQVLCSSSGLGSPRRIVMLEARVYYVGVAGEGSIWPEKALQSLKTLVTTKRHCFTSRKTWVLALHTAVHEVSSVHRVSLSYPYVASRN